MDKQLGLGIQIIVDISFPCPVLTAFEYVAKLLHLAASECYRGFRLECSVTGLN